MLVEDWMSRKPVSVRRSTTLSEAQRQLAKHRFRQLVVTERGRMIGIVTDRDLRAAGSDAKRVGDVMSFDPETIAASDSVDSAAHMLRSWKVNALPVMRDRKLVGVITTSDVLDAFVALSGVTEPSYRVVIVPRKGATLDAVRAAIEGTHSEVRWLRERGKGRAREVQSRVVTKDIESVVIALEAEGHSVSCTITSPGETAAESKRR
jgi:acetoin utilization protein AcuB